MSNLKLWRETSVPVGDIGIEHFESSLVSDLQARVQSRVAQLEADNRGIADVSLSGAGDGYAFMCTLVTQPRLTLTGLEVFFYEAASEPELRVAARQLLTQLGAGGYFIYGHGESGSSMGHRWMGVMLASTED